MNNANVVTIIILLFWFVCFYLHFRNLHAILVYFLVNFYYDGWTDVPLLSVSCLVTVTLWLAIVFTLLCCFSCSSVRWCLMFIFIQFRSGDLPTLKKKFFLLRTHEYKETRPKGTSLDVNKRHQSQT